MLGNWILKLLFPFECQENGGKKYFILLVLVYIIFGF